MGPKHPYQGKLILITKDDYINVGSLVRKLNSLKVEKVVDPKLYDKEEWSVVEAFVVDPLLGPMPNGICIDEKGHTFGVWDEERLRFARENNWWAVISEWKFLTDSDIELITSGQIKPNDEFKFYFKEMDMVLLEVLKGQEQIVYENMCANLMMGEFSRYPIESIGCVIHWLRALGLPQYDTVQIGGLKNGFGEVTLWSERIATFDFNVEKNWVEFDFIKKYDWMQKKQNTYFAGTYLYENPYAKYVKR